MTTHRSPYQPPPLLKNDKGRMRTVGFEIEFSGLSFEEASQVLCDFTGNALERKSAVECSSEHPGLGRFSLEMDWTYLKNYAAEKHIPDSGDTWGNVLKDAAELLVPLEIVCPPVPFDCFEQLDALTTALRKAGASGSESSVIAAYGVHINPEIPARDAPTLLRYIKAFCLLEWWLVDIHQVDFSRRLSTYVDLYPDSYLEKVLSISDQDIPGLLNDYIEDNPTRNRALDLYPLFADFDEEAVRSRMPDPRIKKRPTFHYRLPNCEIKRPGWSLADSWNPWVVVEKLAAEPRLLSELAQTFLHRKRFLLGVHRQQWKDYIDQWLHDHSLV